MLKDLLESKGIWHRIVSITLNPIQYHLRLLGRQEPVPIREVGYEEPRQDAENDGEDTLDSEDPLPPVEPAFAFEEL